MEQFFYNPKSHRYFHSLTSPSGVFTMIYFGDAPGGGDPSFVGVFTAQDSTLCKDLESFRDDALKLAKKRFSTKRDGALEKLLKNAERFDGYFTKFEGIDNPALLFALCLVECMGLYEEIYGIEYASNRFQEIMESWHIALEAGAMKEFVEEFLDHKRELSIEAENRKKELAKDAMSRVR